MASHLNLGTSDAVHWIIPSGAGCPEHYKIFSSISGLYPLAVSHHPPHADSCINQKQLQTLLNVSYGAKSSPDENHISKEKKTSTNLWLLLLLSK